MYRKLDSQPSRRVVASRMDLGIGMAERLALYAFGVACLISFLLESPVPMAIAP